MSEGHFWHDMIENVVIWEADDTPGGTGPALPVEAQQDDLTVHHHDAAPDSGTSADWIEAVPADHPVAEATHHDDDATA